MGAVLFSRLLPLFQTDLTIQWVCFAIAAYFQTEKFYDFSGSCTYLTLIIKGILGAWSRQSGVLSTRQLLNSGAVFLWAARLGTFLFKRILHDGHDRRFDKV